MNINSVLCNLMTLKLSVGQVYKYHLFEPLRAYVRATANDANKHNILATAKNLGPRTKSSRTSTKFVPPKKGHKHKFSAGRPGKFSQFTNNNFNRAIRLTRVHCAVETGVFFCRFEEGFREKQML